MTTLYPVRIEGLIAAESAEQAAELAGYVADQLEASVKFVGKPVVVTGEPETVIA